MDTKFYEKALESSDLKLKNDALQRADELVRSNGLKNGTHSKGENFKTFYGSALESNDLKVKNSALKSAIGFVKSLEGSSEGEEKRTAGTNSWDKKASEKFK